MFWNIFRRGCLWLEDLEEFLRSTILECFTINSQNFIKNTVFISEQRV